MATPNAALGHSPPLDKHPAQPTQAGPSPSLVRRSSFEPMRLGLSSLPPPVFSRAPPGQRSVPAIEFLNNNNSKMHNKDSTEGGISNNSTVTTTGGGGSTTPGSVLQPVLASGTNTPGAGLGNGSMTSEPWNLWSDATAPSASAGSTLPLNSSDNVNQDAVIGSDLPHAPSREDSELASALAASVVLDSKADKRSSIASRVSNSSTSRGNNTGGGIGSIANNLIVGGGADGNDNSSAGGVDVGNGQAAVATATSWPGELAADPSKALQPQNFALDPNASPERRRGGEGNAATGAELGLGTQGTSLLPRNVSFSSMLDLPEPELGSATTGAGSSLDRKGSLTRRVPATAQSPLATLSFPSAINSNNNNNNDSLSLPSLAFSGSSPAASGGSAFTTTPATSYGSTLRQGGNTSPTQSKIYGGNMNPYGQDQYESRSRQGTNASTAGFSDYSSTTSIAFGNFGPLNNINNTNNRGIGGFSNEAFNSNNDAFGNGMLGIGSGIGGNAFNPRRDSGYGPSIYNNSPSVGFGNQFGDDRRGSRGASWQFGGNQYGAPPMSRGGMPPYSYSPPPPPNPYASPFSMASGDGGSFMSLNSTNSSSTNNSSGQSSLLRYPSLGNGVGGGLGSLDFLGPNGSPGLSSFALSYGGGAPPAPVSPKRRYASSGYAAPGPYMLGGDYDRPRGYEEKNRPVRSPLLEEFRADKLKRRGVRDMHAHIAEFMCDQVGSRYIQESILEHPTSEDCDLLFNEVHHLIIQLSTDVFANFCIQKLLEKASTEQIAVMAENLKGNILKLSLQTYGCRVIQKALEVVSPEHQVMILRELEGAVQKCVRDQNANHVIQKIVTTCPPDLLQFVVDAFHGNVYTFATHPYSCRVLQRILENCPERMTRPILEELKSYALNLMQDQYGNYVIQFCLERGLPHDKSDIIVQIHGQVLHFSKHKFASNVIEKCIMNANEHQINMIASEVLAPGIDGTTGIQAMLRHEYANYPLQRLIKHTTGNLHLAIVDQVSMQLAMFREANPPFNAKHLVAVEKLLLDLSPTDFPGLMRRRYEDHYVTRTR